MYIFFGRKVSLDEMSEVLSSRLGCEVICLAGDEEIHAFIENADCRYNIYVYVLYIVHSLA